MNSKQCWRWIRIQGNGQNNNLIKKVVCKYFRVLANLDWDHESRIPFKSWSDSLKKINALIDYICNRFSWWSSPTVNPHPSFGNACLYVISHKWDWAAYPDPERLRTKVKLCLSPGLWYDKICVVLLVWFVRLLREKKMEIVFYESIKRHFTAKIKDASRWNNHHKNFKGFWKSPFGQQFSDVKSELFFKIIFLIWSDF